MSKERRSAIIVLAAATVASIAASAVVLHSGTQLYFGDSVPHLNIGRKLVDNKTLGWDQIGTVWLPLSHILTAITVWYDPFWKSALGGTLPSMIGFIVGAVFLFKIVRRELESEWLAWAALAIYGLNLNLLYLQSTPMTESQMMGIFLAAVWYAGEGRVIPCGLWLLAGTWERYDGWFYVPFIALFFWWKHGFRKAFIVGLIASLGPIGWLVHNHFVFYNWLEWYNGPYAPKAIEAHSTVGIKGPLHPGDHEPWIATLYYWKAVRLMVGNLPCWLAIAGTAVFLWCRRRFSMLLLLWLPVLFYVLSICYGSVPVFTLGWWPFSYYNTRYALQAVPAIAALAPAVAMFLGAYRRYAAIALIVIAGGGWAVGYSKAGPESMLVFREATKNSRDRRDAVNMLSESLLSHGCREILIGGGDLVGALTQTGIPYRRVIHDGNANLWRDALVHPEKSVDCVAEAPGDGVNRAIAKNASFEKYFRLVLDFNSPDWQHVRLWQRRTP